MNDSKNPVILYHTDCPDGFGAAWAAWKKFGDSAVYIPVQHMTPPPAGLEGKDVISLDYAYQVPVLQAEILPKAKSVTIVDHHPTAAESVKILPGSVLDFNHSGAVLSWMYFHPDAPVPALLKYVEDTDLWKFALPHSKEISAYIGLQDHDFSSWSQLAEDLENPDKFKDAVGLGSRLLHRLEKSVAKSVSNAEEIEFEGYKILMVNSQSHASEIGNELVKIKPPISIVWSRRGKRIVISLRGDGSVDLSKLAAKYGGGGHHNASGFSWDQEDFLHFPGI